jgi:hypothetical protein
MRCAVLLTAAVTWLVSVTLCAARVLPEVPHQHPAANEHSDHAHGTGHDHGGKQQDDGCGCESFKAFPAQAAALTKAPAPAVLLLHSILPEEFAYVSAATKVMAQNTGPPGRMSLAEWVMERCLLNHAPPFVV